MQGMGAGYFLSALERLTHGSCLRGGELQSDTWLDAHLLHLVWCGFVLAQLCHKGLQHLNGLQGDPPHRPLVTTAQLPQDRKVAFQTSLLSPGFSLWIMP